ncbi:MAG: calcium-binding protein [Cupriavidus sp.]|nr:calcium-binding protein [Cupriavidus sp.]
MSHRLAATGAAIALLLMSATVSAQPQQPMNAQEAKAKFTEKFNAADADHDGKLTRDEAQASMPEVAKDFDKIDAKKKGYVTQKQIGAYYAAKAKQRRAQDPGNLN